MKLKKKKYLKIKKIIKFFKFNSFESVQNYGIFCGDQNLYKILTIKNLIDRIKNIDGDIIEFGTWNGNTAFLIKKILDIYKIKKKLYLFDHFRGLENFSAGDNLKKEFTQKGKYKGKKKLIEKIIKFFKFKKIYILNEDANDLIFDRFEKFNFSLIIIDVDLYNPTKNILRTAAKRLNKNGLIVFDEGNKKGYTGEANALLEFYKQNKNIYSIEYLDKNRQPDVILKKLK